MTEERKEQIKKEAKRRLDLWITNSTFDEMTQYGIFICFDKSLGMFQNPFAPILKREHG